MSEQTASTPAAAAKDSPFENSLGMRFVPVPRFSTLFSIWPVRVRDFEAYTSAHGIPMPEQAHGSNNNHPAVNVVWREASEFCKWLTKTEQESGKIPKELVYRLPSDMEWSAAVGLPHESGARPDERSGHADGFPWGTDWPPPKNSGNYSQELGVDDFEFTSPVGTFPANQFGIYDLGGNVWEWCHDFYDRANECRVLRGASWFNGYPDRMKSSFRNDLGYPDARYTSFGFRAVLGAPLSR